MNGILIGNKDASLYLAELKVFNVDLQDKLLTVINGLGKKWDIDKDNVGFQDEFAFDATRQMTDNSDYDGDGVLNKVDGFPYDKCAFLDSDNDHLADSYAPGFNENTCSVPKDYYPNDPKKGLVDENNTVISLENSLNSSEVKIVVEQNFQIKSLSLKIKL